MNWSFSGLTLLTIDMLYQNLFTCLVIVKYALADLHCKNSYSTNEYMFLRAACGSFSLFFIIHYSSVLCNFSEYLSGIKSSAWQCKFLSYDECEW